MRQISGVGGRQATPRQEDYGHEERDLLMGGGVGAGPRACPGERAATGGCPYKGEGGRGEAPPYPGRLIESPLRGVWWLVWWGIACRGGRHTPASHGWEGEEG